VDRPPDQQRFATDTVASGPGTPVGLSRRRLCGVALTLLGAAGTGLITACGGGGDSSEARSGDGGPREIELPGEGDAPVMFSTPTCGCCGEYAPYLQSNGHDVEVRHFDDLSEVKARAGVPAEAESCHTTIIDGYVVEGHIPVEAIDKLLRERPAIDGIALPGMPAGSPGMGGSKTAPFEILSINSGTLDSYMSL
jgi:hypothetical protein